MATTMAQPEPALEALRSDAALAEHLAERRRQEVQRTRNAEDQQLRDLQVQQRQEALQDRVATRRVLDEMRQVRQRVQGQLRASEAQAFHAESRGGHALVRAGKRALTAQQHQQQWEAQAAMADQQMQQSMAVDREMLRNIQQSAAERIAVMDEIAAKRVEKSQELLHFSREQEISLKLQNEEQQETKLRQAMRNSKIQVENVSRAADDAKGEMKLAESKAARAQQRMTRDVERSLQAGAARISGAERQLKVQEEEMKAALQREELCALQIKRVAQEWKENAQEELHERKQDLQVMLERVSDYEHCKKTPHQDAQISMQVKTEEVSHRGTCVALAARKRAGEELEDLERRLVVAQEQLAKLQVKCAASVKELQSKWEAAKTVYAEKVSEVESETEDLLQRLKAHHEMHEDYCMHSLRKTAALQEERRTLVQNQGALSQELVQHRAAFCQQKSAQTRRQAEARLEQTKRHVEDVERRCQERVLMGKDIAEEKVRISQQRLAEQVDVAERRAHEAMDARDKASVAFHAALVRCSGAADEARRRGLYEVAEILLPSDAWCGFNTLRPKTAEESTRPVTTSTGVEVWTLGKETASTAFPDRGGTPLEAPPTR